MGIGIGAAGGQGIRGYYQARNAREDTEWMGKVRERIERLQSSQDPIDQEKAQIMIEGLRRENEFGMETQGSRINHSRRNEEYAAKSHPGNMRGIKFRDNNMRRSEEFSAAAHPGDMAGIRYRDNTARRGEELSGAMQPVRMGQANYQANQMDLSQQVQETARNMHNALANFRQFGNVQALVDAYDEYWPDGKQVNITPAGNQYKKGHYQIEFEGQGAIVSPEQLSQFFEEEFLNPQKIAEAHGQFQDPMGGMFSSVGNGYGVFGSGRGPGGSRMGSAMQETLAMFQALATKNGINPDITTPEGAALWIQAHEATNTTGNQSSQTRAQEFFLKTQSALISGGWMPSPEEAFEKAQELTRKYMQLVGGRGFNPNTQGSGIQSGGQRGAADQFDGSQNGEEDWLSGFLK